MRVTKAATGAILALVLLSTALLGCEQDDYSSTSEPPRLPSHAPPGYHSGPAFSKAMTNASAAKASSPPMAPKPPQ